jgi:hypothetical protein
LLDQFALVLRQPDMLFTSRRARETRVHVTRAVFERPGRRADPHTILILAGTAIDFMTLATG